MAITAFLASAVPRNAPHRSDRNFLRMTLSLYTLAHARSVCATKNSQPVKDHTAHGLTLKFATKPPQVADAMIETARILCVPRLRCAILLPPLRRGTKRH